MAGKIDVKKQYKHLFAPKREPHLVEVPTFRYWMIDGKGSPDGAAFQDAISALYSTAYTTKFRLKAGGRADFVVPPLEALWWADDESAFDENRADEWEWTLMLVQPDHVSEEDTADVLEVLDKKGKITSAHRNMRTEQLEEGQAVQCLYVGPYNSMGGAISTMQAFAESNGLELAGKHHDVYLSDPRRTAREKLKTVLRRPVR
ncbi:MAG: GyrI-like domain-containing protein [Bryobacterales bacterium]|nr:GyrI-like domain-containing protein [Bryobacterales bacterium]